ncbi:MAG: molybdenum cofactor guanylyltransferase [Kordiimonadaceae bacterium]|jgi:molybdenum cofactor guanylyltransferase|nr:molybdenum cofactor guanylyltransferase [Kordiimonadaceae bacterium]MBT6035520.1 molybdenum cofactor guanylyltransferase [Kordiimonadaceae bacterium]MBT6328802.1 molybdenum cofactor guanylyltransferase [Kordiimonadaceae bacterium]MBT7582766.1 molybdenum cofactor guanylyltransferase [Kordiimonadaceae bacterium]
MINQAIHNAPVLGVILAGGRSSRMGGRDKFLLTLGGKTILDHITERLSPQVDKLILNANRQIDTALEVVPDLEQSAGPMAGLYTALNYAKENDFSHIVTVPCDTPFIPDDFVLRLLEHSENPIVAAKSAGRIHPVLALWHISLLDELKQALQYNQRKMMDFIAGYPVSEVCWDTAADPFFNINTADDLAAAEKLVK